MLRCASGHVVNALLTGHTGEDIYDSNDDVDTDDYGIDGYDDKGDDDDVDSDDYGDDDRDGNDRSGGGFYSSWS